MYIFYNTTVLKRDCVTILLFYSARNPNKMCSVYVCVYACVTGVADQTYYLVHNL